MDQRRLVELVKQMPKLWDRNCPMFRDKDAKDRGWEEIGRKMDQPGSLCREAFKALREKYLRERAKDQQHPDQNWDMLSELQFLEPHIVPRSSCRNAQFPFDDDMSINSDSDPTDFDKQLIHMVRKASPIWDRNSNTYPNKMSKYQLWEQIGTALNRDVNSCQLRWKALREKYIRQKAKFLEGEAKWELLDDLVFLDKVIQYRRKQGEYGGSHGPHGETGGHLGRNNYSSYHSEGSYIQCNTDGEEYNYTDSSNDFLSVVKEESAVLQVADSSNACKRLRAPSVGSYGEPSSEKRTKFDECGEPSKSVISSSETTPEQLFGGLVTSLLTKKPESQRNLYMIEIMRVLSK